MKAEAVACGMRRCAAQAQEFRCDSLAGESPGRVLPWVLRWSEAACNILSGGEAGRYVPPMMLTVTVGTSVGASVGVDEGAHLQLNLHLPSEQLCMASLGVGVLFGLSSVM